ncbi:MAG: hypothetical protein JWQ90_1972 [Hydrocarboniphaga sp.]|nr:hypothetical protein [Hydrocarboniphaga sp.]
MYAVAGWLLVQVVTQVFPVFHVGERIQQFIVIAIIAGFPLALVLSWIYELTPQGIVKTDEVSPEASITPRTGQQLDRAIIGVLLAAVLVLMAKLFWPPPTPTVAATGGPASGKSVAVLPFENLSDDRANAYFATGIQDEILTRLAGIGDLKVISRTSTEKYASHPDNLRTVAAELGVAALLEGSVQKAGERVRVNVQLIDARSDAHLWASTYDRELKDVFAVESEVSQAIADALKAKLSPVEISALSQAPTANAAAYDRFLKAEYALHKATDSNRQADFLLADELYRQALALDPDFALAQAQLAYSMMSRHWFATPLTPAELADVKTLVDRALAHAPGLAEAHLASGYWHYWGFRDYEPAKTEFRGALSLAPNNAQAIAALGFVQRRQGEWADAAATLSAAIAYAPRDNTLIGNYGQTYTVMRRYGDAEQAMKRALAIDPDDMQSRTFLTVNYLMGSGDVPAALAVFADLPLDRRAPPSNTDGDVMNVVNVRVYPSLFARRFDQALLAWPMPPAETPAQHIERLSARVAIQMLAGRRAGIQAECAELRGLLVTQREHQQTAFQQTSALSWAELCLGHDDAARDIAHRAVAAMPPQKDAWNSSYFLVGEAQIDAQTGHADEAVAIIVQLLVIAAGDAMSMQRLKLDPVWDPLRSDPRFAKIIADGVEARL